MNAAKKSLPAANTESFGTTFDPTKHTKKTDRGWGRRASLGELRPQSIDEQAFGHEKFFANPPRSRRALR